MVLLHFLLILPFQISYLLGMSMYYSLKKVVIGFASFFVNFTLPNLSLRKQIVGYVCKVKNWSLNTVFVRHVCNYYLVGAIFQANQFSLQSVLQQASSIMSSGDDHLLTTIQEHYTMAGQLISLTKKQGVSGNNFI